VKHNIFSLLSCISAGDIFLTLKLREVLVDDVVGGLGSNGGRDEELRD